MTSAPKSETNTGRARDEKNASANNKRSSSRYPENEVRRYTREPAI